MKTVIAKIKSLAAGRKFPPPFDSITFENCHDCNAKPGQPHTPGCDTERCSVCADQRMVCGCKGHDGAFARWTGFWPGALESIVLGIDLNTFYGSGFHKFFFVKPNKS